MMKHHEGRHGVLFRQFADNEDFKRWLGGVVFEVAYEGAG